MSLSVRGSSAAFSVADVVRILLLNWRDTRSPRAGGAEHLTHEVARRLVLAGHEVTWFTSRPDGSPDYERIDGVGIVRRGTELTTRLAAPAFARRRIFDVVVEQINTLPYFAPVWAQAPTVLWINQLAREVWWYEAPWLAAAAGFISEPAYLRAYRRVPVLTISDSTRDDLRRLGLRGRIDVMPMAVDTPPVASLASKSLDGRLVAVGRLTPSKRYDHAIRALMILRGSHPSATLTIAGEGRDRGRLESLVAELGLGDAVRLPGSVSDDEKTALLTEADVLVGCSVREGWGLTVTEAARRGTPSVVYDIPGFRDAVVDGRTGVLTGPTPTALAHGVRGMINNVARYDRMRASALRESLELDWQRSAGAVERVLEAAAAGPGGLRSSQRGSSSRRRRAVVASRGRGRRSQREDR
jgi:glycosyltransferase involved in cell wall biosynthesis